MTTRVHDRSPSDKSAAGSAGLARVARWPALAAAAAASIGYIYLGIQPQNPSAFDLVPDYVAHAGAYGLMTLVAATAAGGFGVRRPALLAAAYAVAHGALLEVVQYFHPPRTAEWHDLASDAVGALLAAAVWTGEAGRRFRREGGDTGGSERRPGGRDDAGPST